MSNQRFNTGNPIGSNSPLDRSDNTRNLDVAVNSNEAAWTDRLGRSRRSMAGVDVAVEMVEDAAEEATEQTIPRIVAAVDADAKERLAVAESGWEVRFQSGQDLREQQFRTFIASSGYQFAGEYAAGIEITQYNQILRDENGEFWRVSGQVDLPYVTTGAGIPEGDALVPSGDAVLRQDLANPDMGASIVGYQSGSVSDFLETVVTRDQCGGLIPSALEAVQVQTDADRTLPVVCDAIGDKFYGYRSGRMYVSQDALNWVDFCNPPASNTVLGLRPTSDGEVLALMTVGVFKSQGWGNASVIWSQKTFSNGLAAPQAFSFDGDGSKFIVAEYGPGAGQAWIDSRYAYISVDAGETFYMAYDSDEVSGNTPEESHLHGVSYDPWNDTFYVSEGHGPGGGIYHSTDNGTTWSLADGMKIEEAGSASPTSITATDGGLVCGSDGNSNQGVYGVVRTPNPMHQQLRYLWAWRPLRSGNNGWGAKQVRDPRTGMVYCAWKTQGQNVAPMITGATPFSAGPVYTYPGSSFALEDVFEYLALNDDGLLAAVGTIGGDLVTVVGNVPPPAGKLPLDTGGVMGGVAPDALSVAVGNSAIANSLRSTAVGVEASSTQDGVAVGYQSNAEHASTTAVGYQSRAVNGSSTAYGANSNSEGGASLAVGAGADAKANAVAIGRNAEAAVGNTAVGREAKATIGSNAIAIGQSTQNTASFQLAIGPRHLEMGIPATYPASPTAGNFRLAVGVDVFQGPVRLVAMFSGASIPLATINGAGCDPATNTGNLPAAASVGVGARFFNTSLGKPVWSNGVAWVDAMGDPIA